jgi:hypothetical protein
MTSANKLRKASRDGWVPALTVVRESELRAFALAAKRSGMSVNEWMRDRLVRIAPEASQ